MNKFLRISGIIFWIQIIVIGCYSTLMLFNAYKYEDELFDFSRSLESDILDKRDWAKSSNYFHISLTKESSFSMITEHLNTVGPLSSCKFSLPIEISSDGASSEATAECKYEKSIYTFNFSLQRRDAGWIITKSRVTSDAFQVRL